MTSLSTELSRAIELVGGRERFEKQAKQYRSDSEYLEQNQEELLQEYTDQWIAVYNGSVQAAANDAETLIKMIESKNLSTSEVLISFLSSKETVALF
ncbi:MAG: hypothetical protein KAW13_03535 [Dehalococcoidia bacterium]|nr:hypothetical protein [Dehalococcoidia bacterium]